MLAGKTTLISDQSIVGLHHITVCSGDYILRKCWEIEEGPKDVSNLTPEEHAVTLHSQNTHSNTGEGRFVVSPPKDPQARPLGKSRSQAVRRFMTMEHKLHVMEEQQSKCQWQTFKNHVRRYSTFLCMYAVRKEHSTFTKITAVFDASAKTSTKISLNDTLLVGPTVHSSLIDVLLRFN